MSLVPKLSFHSTTGMPLQPNYLKSVALVGGLVVLIGLAAYPIIIQPKLHPEKYRKFVVR